MLKFTSEPIRKGKMYYWVEYANPIKTESGWKYGVTYAICDTHQKANGLVRKDANENWYGGNIDNWNPLVVTKGYYI